MPLGQGPGLCSSPFGACRSGAYRTEVIKMAAAVTYAVAGAVPLAVIVSVVAIAATAGAVSFATILVIAALAAAVAEPGRGTLAEKRFYLMGTPGIGRSRGCDA
jgi:hypothetical protein